MNLKSILLACGLVLLMTLGVRANNMLVQNVTTLGNDAVNKTIQVQFDINWDNSWRDAINYDAAWIFMKFKNASGVWQHVQLNQTGFVNGTGTANTVQVTSDKVGCWLYRTGLGSGTFNSTGMQLQWNYGLAGLTNVTGLEVRVFAVEMVYVPEGEFNCARTFYTNISTNPPFAFDAPGSNFPVINSRLSPSLSYNDGTTAAVRIKGDAGIDTNNDGAIDNTSYPLGYRAFYCCKYEITEQQYADFLNTLSSAQITTIGIAGSGITLTNGQHFSSTPNRACAALSNGATSTLNTLIISRLLSYADWAAIRPISFTEINKASYGPIQPVANTSICCASGTNYQFPAWGSNTTPNNWANAIGDVGSSANSTSDRSSSGASYYGIMNLTGNGRELVVKLNYLNYTSQNGNGILGSDGNHDISSWSTTTSMVVAYEQMRNSTSNQYVFRYVRSAE